MWFLLFLGCVIVAICLFRIGLFLLLRRSVNVFFVVLGMCHVAILFL